MCQKLPNEIFIKIFKNLSHTDLLKVSEVSKRFCGIATDPSFWKDFDFSQRTLNDKIHLLQLSRFKKLKMLTITTTTHDCGDENKILELLMNIDLKELKLEKFIFKKIDKKLLASVICKTEAVKINVSDEDIELQKLGREIIEKIPGGNIKVLRLNRMDFSGIDSRTLAKSINSLQFLWSPHCIFDQSQIMETMEEILRETNLDTLYLTAEVLKNVPAGILSKALNKMELLIIGGREKDSLSSEQMMEFFREMSHQTNLWSLLMTLMRKCTDVLTKAINKLTRFGAPYLNLSGSQIKSVFFATNNSCRIRDLTFGYICIGMIIPLALWI